MILLPQLVPCCCLCLQFAGLCHRILGLVAARLGQPEPGHEPGREDIPDRQGSGAAEPSRLHGAGPEKEDMSQCVQETELHRITQA